MAAIMLALAGKERVFLRSADDQTRDDVDNSHDAGMVIVRDGARGCQRPNLHGVFWQAQPPRHVPQAGPLKFWQLLSRQARVAVADAAHRQIQGIDIARQALGLGYVDNLFHEKIGQMLIEALTA